MHRRTSHGHHADRHPLAKERDPEHGTKSTSSLRFMPSVFKVDENVGNVNCLSFQRGPANKCLPTQRDRPGPHIIRVFWRKAETRRQAISLAFTTKHKCAVRLAKVCR